MNPKLSISNRAPARTSEAAEPVGRVDPETPAAPGPENRGICLATHPLLQDVRCQRLAGHPGPHGAEVETRSAEMYLEWRPGRAPE